MPWPTPNVIGLPFDARFGRWGGPDDYLYSPTQLPSLAAWFDALDTRTMLSGDGSTITDGGAVALWGDKSGNSGVNAFVSVGGSGNYASVLDGTWCPTGSIDARVYLRSSDYTPSANQVLMEKYGAAGNRSFSFYINATTGVLTFIISTDGTANVTANSTAAPTATDYAQLWLRATRDSTSGDVEFWQSPDGATWTQVGATVSTAAGGIFDSTATLAIGAGTSGSANFAGTIYRSQLYASTDGTDQRLDIDFSTAGKKLANGDTFVCATGQTVTLNSSGATGARIAGERDLYQGTLANRPVYLQYAGTKYGYLNGASGAYFSTPDSAGISITGDIDLRACLKLPDWTPAAESMVLAKDESGKRSYTLSITATGRIAIGFSSDGTTLSSLTSSASPTVSDGDVLWIRATLDVDNGAAGKTATFYTSTDGETWSALGTPQTSATAITISDNDSVLQIGANFLTANRLTGNVLRAQAYNGIGGTLVADFNPALYTSGTTFTASTGEVWTINGGAHIVTRTGLYFDGSNDYLKTAAFSLSQPETVYLTGQQVSWTDGDYFYDGNTNLAMVTYQQGTTPRIVARVAGTLTTQNAGFVLKEGHVLSSVFNGASVSQTRIDRLAAVAGSVGTTAANGFTLAGDAGGGSNSNVSVSEVAIYSAAHATATQDRMALYAGRRHGFTV